MNNPFGAPLHLFDRLSLRLKLNLFIFVPAMSILAALILFNYYSQSNIVKESALQEAKNVVQGLEATRAYLSEKVEGDTALYQTSRFLDLIPAVVLARVSRDYEAQQGYRVRQMSENPRNPANAADSLDLALLAKADAGNRAFVCEKIDDKNRGPYFRFVYPLYADGSCLLCHSSPEKSPPIINAAYGSVHGFGFKPGDLLGGYSIDIPVQSRAAEIKFHITRSLTFAAIALLMGVVMISLLVKWTVITPVTRILQGVSQHLPGQAPGAGLLLKYRNEFRFIEASVGEMLKKIKKAHSDELLSAEQKHRHELLSSEKMALVGKLSSQVAHEIRNPLGSIGLNLELLGEEFDQLKEGNDTEAKHLIEAIRREIKRLSNITNDYLEYGRLALPEKKEVDLKEVAGEVARLLREEARSRDISLSFEGGEWPLRVAGDPNKVKQVVINLCKNAIEACGPGGKVQLRIFLKEGKPSLEVRDSGRGIENGQLAKIFDPFYTDKPGGTGLGLSITKQIVEEMEGKIEVQSWPGQGSLFTVTF